MKSIVLKLERYFIKRRITKNSVAKMLISKHSLISLDEGLFGLDEEMKKMVISKRKERSKKNIIIIFHDNEIQRICDEILLMLITNTKQYA